MFTIVLICFGWSDLDDKIGIDIDVDVDIDVNVDVGNSLEDDLSKWQIGRAHV